MRIHPSKRIIPREPKEIVHVGESNVILATSQTFIEPHNLMEVWAEHLNHVDRYSLSLDSTMHHCYNLILSIRHVSTNLSCLHMINEKC